jgi:hypothetical protein
MDNNECDHERMVALLSASTRAAALSTDQDARRVQSLNLMVRGFAVEMTAENLVNQVDQIAVDLNQLKSRLDSLSELGETESLRLQMAMDRLSKMMATLSNVLKKVSDTAESITRNVK